MAPHICLLLALVVPNTLLGEETNGFLVGSNTPLGDETNAMSSSPSKQSDSNTLLGEGIGFLAESNVLLGDETNAKSSPLKQSDSQKLDAAASSETTTRYVSDTQHWVSNPWVFGFVLGPIVWKWTSNLLFKLLQCCGRCSPALEEHLKTMTELKQAKLKVNMVHAIAFLVLFIAGFPLICQVFKHWGTPEEETWMTMDQFTYYRSIAWILSVNYIWQLVCIADHSWDLWLHHTCTLLVQALSYGTGAMALEGQKQLINWGLIYGWFHSTFFILNICMVFYHTKTWKVHHVMAIGCICHGLKNLSMNVFGYAYVFVHWNMISTIAKIILLLAPVVFVPAQIVGTLQVYQIMMKARKARNLQVAEPQAAPLDVEGSAPQSLSITSQGVENEELTESLVSKTWSFSPAFSLTA